MRNLDRKPLVIVVLLALGSLLAGCAGTKWVTTWTEPNIGTMQPMKTILVVGMSADMANRRMFEDAMRDGLKPYGVQVTPSYGVLPEGQATEEVLRAKVTEGGYDGVLIGRLVSKDEKTSYVAPSVGVAYGGYGYGPYWGGYGGWYGTTYSPGYLMTETIVRIQTRLWSAKGEGMPVWTGVSETINPSKVATVTKEVAYLVGQDLRAKKLI